LNDMTGKQRMLNAYRGVHNDRVAIAPEFWYYYPAKLLGVDMIEFEREVPFHQALLTTFAKFGCEGWGAAFAGIRNDKVTTRTSESWIDDDTLEVSYVTHTAAGDLTSRSRYTRDEPSWQVERPMKSLADDLAAWEIASLGGSVDDMDCSGLVRACEEVGESYLLEAWVGVPFFDFFAGAREGGFETAIMDFMDPDLEPKLIELQQRYTEQIVGMTRVICEKTPMESLAIGCSWSCNSLIGPNLWRRWDKPVVKAVADEIHRHGKLLHIHFHGKCMETVVDFAEIGIDCVCPFERPPGGDVATVQDLETVARTLSGRTTMNGNIHTVNTLIRGSEEDVRSEVREVLTAFAGNPRIILGTGDQVGRETPEENIYAMIDEAKLG
jgi:uroporphyrinogen decarboxylase